MHYIEGVATQLELSAQQIIRLGYEQKIFECSVFPQNTLQHL